MKSINARRGPGGEPENPVVRQSANPAALIENPVPATADWIDPPSFAEALNLHMVRYGESYYKLHKALIQTGEKFTSSTLRSWMSGARSPGSAASLQILSRIEKRYNLTPGYFKAKLPQSRRANQLTSIDGVSKSELRRLSWHLPDDFAERSFGERAEILDWVRTVVISGATDYRRYQAAAMKNRYAVRFPSLTDRKASLTTRAAGDDSVDSGSKAVKGGPDAPAHLLTEMRELIRFKTSTLADFGYQRSGVWGEETTSQKIEHFGLMFGALAASPKGAVAGLGVPVEQLSFALLIFPKVWDWYIQWREKRRGFFTRWESDMLRNAIAMVRSETGWIRQHPEFADRLCPIDGLVLQGDVDAAKSDWALACETMHIHAHARVKEVERVARVHRDPFEPILPILEAPSPVSEYLKIAEEVLKHRPDARRHPRAAAEVTRSYLILRLGLHLGLRQKNLRQLLICPRGQYPRTERQLETLKRGELRWSDRDHGWEVLVPSAAFKNAHSSFFSGKPFRLILPDLGGLYDHIESYLREGRALLLNGADDPETFFVKSMKSRSRDGAYDQCTFYEAWRLIIQRYGIFNPYTGRGAIKGLLPHGPHNVRDVLATHILKQTGSYEQASYGIQDTPDMVAKHYGRFLPQDKSAMAAQILNRVWEAA